MLKLIYSTTFATLSNLLKPKKHKKMEAIIITKPKKPYNLFMTLGQQSREYIRKKLNKRKYTYKISIPIITKLHTEYRLICVGVKNKKDLITT